MRGNMTDTKPWGTARKARRMPWGTLDMLPLQSGRQENGSGEREKRGGKQDYEEKAWGISVIRRKKLCLEQVQTQQGE